MREGKSLGPTATERFGLSLHVGPAVVAIAGLLSALQVDSPDDALRNAIRLFALAIPMSLIPLAWTAERRRSASFVGLFPVSPGLFLLLYHLDEVAAWGLVVATVAMAALTLVSRAHRER